MKSEEEITKLKNIIESVLQENNPELAEFVELNNKGGHWLDCLVWILDNEA